MTLHVLQFVSILLTALTFGVFWGPWIGLTRSMSGFGEEAFLAIVHRMDRNLGNLMTILFPVTLAAVIAVAVLSFGDVAAFCLTLAALLCLVISLLVTVRIEVPVVEQVRSWTVATMPGDWRALRDRWVSFHLARVLPGFIGLGLLLAAAVFAAV